MSEAIDSHKRLRIAVVGAGMAGILAAVRLLEAGRHEVVVYEKADRVGGTWRENTYLDADGVPSTWPWSYDAFAEQTAGPRWQEFDLVA